MKTNTNLISRILLSCLLLFIFNFSAQAQGQWPYPGTESPLLGAPATSTSLADDVDCGLLQPTDSQIWVKVNGNIAGPTPHNKMHNYVTAGSTVEVNFNVNKNRNRYTLVSYTVKSEVVNGQTVLRRTIFDYQSNLYNNGSPVQGNSNQQKVLVPKNCNWEIYLVKGCLVPTFIAGTRGGAPTTGPTGNPYEASKNGNNNLIIDYAYGNGADLANCDVCPQIVTPSPGYQVYFRLIEVIDNTTEKKLVFSVINTTNTQNPDYNYIDYIGDVFFSNITPTHHPRNNTPYQFRYSYQAGPVISGYTVPNNWFGPKDAFVFDQRNNHNNLNYATYQSELFMFSVDNTEYGRLSGLVYDPNDANYNPNVIPQICAELSGKHPEPHKTLPPIFCSDINFKDCACPVTRDECSAQNCDYKILFRGTSFQGSGATLVYTPSFDIFNRNTGVTINKIEITTLGDIATGATSLPIGNSDIPRVFTITPAVDLLTFANPNPNWDIMSFRNFAYSVLGSTVAVKDPITGVVDFKPGNTVTVTITGSGKTLSGTFDLTALIATDCQIVPLPVELTTFTGKAISEGIALNWKTASEKNNDRFEIERSSDGRNFEKIGTVKGNGTSNVAHSYSFLDKYAQAGINYYRLNQVDFGGTNERSQIIKVLAEKAGTGLGVQLIPNPCHDQNCTVQLKGVDTNAPITVELRDLTGRLIFSQQVAADQTSFQMPRVESGNGIYILSARNGNATTYQKIVIQ